MIGLGVGISTPEDFQRRAFLALRNVVVVPRRDYLNLEHLRGEAMSRRNALLPESDLQMLYEIVRRYRDQISDQLVIDYALDKCRGAD